MEAYCGPRMNRRFWYWMGGYVVTLLVGTYLVSGRPRPDAAHLAAAIVPMIPLFGALGETYRTILDMDELQKRIHIEGLVLSLIATAAIVLSVGLLQMIAGFPLFTVFWLWVPICGFYALGVHLGRRRYQ
jgi:hypothetical protein